MYCKLVISLTQRVLRSARKHFLSREPEIMKRAQEFIVFNELEIWQLIHVYNQTIKTSFGDFFFFFYNLVVLVLQA